jgi:hypothetical protein
MLSTKKFLFLLPLTKSFLQIKVHLTEYNYNHPNEENNDYDDDDDDDDNS